MDGTAGWRGPNDARVWDGRPRQEQARPRSFRLNTDAQLGPSFHRAEPGPPGSRLGPFSTAEPRRNKREQEQCLFHPFRDFQCHQRAYFPSTWPIVADFLFCSCVRGRPESRSLTDIWRFVRAVRAVLLSVTTPAFGDAGHLVFAHKLLGAARFGVIVCFGSWKRRGKEGSVITSNVFESQKHRQGCESEGEHLSSTGCSFQLQQS